MASLPPILTFKKATRAQQDLIFSWLQKPHVQEFWDNSQEHKDNIKAYLAGSKNLFDYWIGFADGLPYALLMTSDIVPIELETSAYAPKTGKSVSIDIMIGDENYLGKGLGATTLKAFMEFICDPSILREPQDKLSSGRAQDKNVEIFTIDPAQNNPKAVHVYEKAGFFTLCEITNSWGQGEYKKHFLMIKKV